MNENKGNRLGLNETPKLDELALWYKHNYSRH